MEARMNTSYPFIHKNEQKKKEFEPIPLYVELVPPQEIPLEKKEDQEDKEERVIIIQIL
jgi:hypothetical protein